MRARLVDGMLLVIIAACLGLVVSGLFDITRPEANEIMEYETCLTLWPPMLIGSEYK